jgi:hypothetical protein
MKAIILAAAMVLLALPALASQREELQNNSGYTADGRSLKGNDPHREMDMMYINKYGYRYYGGWGEWLATGRQGPGVPGSNEPGFGDPGGAPNKGNCNCGR